MSRSSTFQLSALRINTADRKMKRALHYILQETIVNKGPTVSLKFSVTGEGRGGGKGCINLTVYRLSQDKGKKALSCYGK